MSNHYNPASPCPKCQASCVLISTQQLKVCVDCGWKNTNWQREKNQPALYRDKPCK